MRFSAYISLAFAALASAKALKRQSVDGHLIEACYPGASEASNSGNFSSLDLTAPCNAVENLTYACTVGSLTRPNLDAQGDTIEFSNTTQRDCICSSQFWSVVQGCQDCLKAHGASAQVAGGSAGDGGDDAGILLSPSDLASASASYCAASSTPTADLFAFLESLGPSPVPDSSSLSTTVSASDSSATSSTFSDPLGETATAVSLYYTPAVTGTAIVSVPEDGITPTTSGQSFSQSLVTDSAGVIVAAIATTTTATTETSTTPSDTTASATTPISEALVTWIPQPLIGVVALAGAVALL
nr:hypothetical protein CFP56_03225 [Quercus suber]